MSSTTTESTPRTSAEVLGGMRVQMQDMLNVLWAARPPLELLDVAAQIEKLRSTLDAVSLTVFRQIDVADAQVGEGWSTTKQYIEAVSGEFQGYGSSTIKLAEALENDFARVAEELAKALISRTQAEVIVRAVKKLPVKKAVRDQAIEVLLELAHQLPTSELKQAGKHLRAVLDPKGIDAEEERKLDEEERAAYLERFLTITEDGLGGVRIRGRATTEMGAVIKKALMSLSAPVTTDPGLCGGHGVCPEPSCAHDGKDPRDHGTRMIDALVEGCRRLMSAEVLPTSHGASPRLTLTMGLDDLRRGIGTATLDTGESLSATAVRRLACDCELIPMVLGSEGQALDVGRAQRLVTVAIWTALVVRDGHCAFPGCQAPPIACDAHHIVHWLAGGATSLENLVLLCRRHHTIVHNSPWEVRLNAEDKKPDFFPPPRLDPLRRPIRRRRPRE
jgi:hypothetical protein